MTKEDDSLLVPSNREQIPEPTASTVIAVLLGILGLIEWPVAGLAITRLIAGGAAAGALSAWQASNHKKFAQAVQDSFRQVDQAKIDKTSLDSDEFVELVIQSVEASARSASDRKCKALANALLSSVVQPTCEFSNKVGIIRVISQMSDEEQSILKVLHDHSIGPQPDGSFIDTEKISGTLDINRSEALAALNGLQQLGLAYDFVNTFSGFESRQGLWRITHLGTRSIQYALATVKEAE